ncbi:MAG: 60S ribosomal protein L31 [Candidatus Aenigmarchaeota archaeon]|nr:60S ribosomal protein L31 [Candidatus Aenigmarchaeota archaeon]
MAESVFTINIQKEVVNKPRWERSKFAVRAVREFLKKKMKTDKIKLDNSISKAVWTRGATKPLHKIKIKVEKEEDVFVAKLAES